MIKQRIAAGLVYIAALLLATDLHAAPGVAAEAETPEQSFRVVMNKKFVLGVAASINRFDSSYRLQNSDSIPIAIDGEDLLGLSETNILPIIYGAWRINHKHALGFHAFKIFRTGDDLNVDGNFGDVSIDGQISVSDKSGFYNASYGYTLAETRNIWVKGMFGVYVIDLKFDFDATGDISIDGVPVVDGKYTEELNQFAPLPMIGLKFWATVTDKWALGARFTAVGGEYADVKAIVVDGAISARYQFTDHLAFITGVMYFNGDIDIKNSNGRSQTVKYGYDGVYLGLDVNF